LPEPDEQLFVPLSLQYSFDEYSEDISGGLVPSASVSYVLSFFQPLLNKIRAWNFLAQNGHTHFTRIDLLGSEILDGSRESGRQGETSSD
jgi:hypothetical protein